MRKGLIFLRNLLLPALIHILIVGAFSTIDPCNNNPGCMAGTPTIYFLFLVSAPVMLVLLVTNIVQLLIEKPNYAKYLKVNLGIALIPFPLVVVIVYAMRSFT